MSIDQYNGGTMVGMVGKNCVGIATDRRLGKQMLTVSNHFQRVFKMQDNIILGLSGLASDVLTFHAEMENRINLYNLRENKQMKPTTFCNLVAFTLFERRFGNYFVQPIVAGIQDGKPILCSYDSIGAQCMIERFQCAGTGATQLFGLCEANYSQDTEKEQLSFKLHQIITSACDRDMYSGWGGVVYTLDSNGDTTVFLKTKQT